MASWTAVAKPALQHDDAELHGMIVDSDVSDGDRPRPRPRWTTPTIMLGAACGLAALGTVAAFFAPWTSPARQSQGGGSDDAHVTIFTDNRLEALDNRRSPAEGATLGPGPLHVADFQTFESKAAAAAAAVSLCQIPCGRGNGTCSSVLAGLLDEATDSMPPGSDPSCGSAQELVKQRCPFCSCCGDLCAVSSRPIALGARAASAGRSIEWFGAPWATSGDVAALGGGAEGAPAGRSIVWFGGPWAAGAGIALGGGAAGAPTGRSIVWFGAAEGGECNNPYTVNISLRDFNSSHPDFQQQSIAGLCKGLVDPVLAKDFTPVLSATAGSLPGKCAQAITGSASFHDWYHDTAKSFPVGGSTLRLCQNLGTGFYEYDDKAYFVLDGKGWDERISGKPDHNYGYTMHFTNYFNMVGGEDFLYRGDDDVWVFFSKCDKGTDVCEPSKLGIDLGGVHRPEQQTVQLEQLGFKPGDYVRMDFFWAERHTNQSNLRISTSIVFDSETTTTSRTSTSRTSTTKTTTSGTSTTNTDTDTTMTKTATATTVTTTATTTTPSEIASFGVPPPPPPPPNPNPCEDGCDGKTCAVKLVEIINESGEGSSPPITLPEVVLVLLKMCPNCESCDVCPRIASTR